MLYNAEQKKKFINYYAKSDVVAKQSESIFSRIGDIEEKYDVDLCCTCDKDKLLEMVGCISSNRSTSTNWKLKMLQQYVRWCFGKVKNVSDEIFDISFEDVNDLYIKEHMASDPKDMDSYLKSFLRSDDEITIDIVYKCVLWMAYAGIKENKMQQVKSADVDLDVVGDEFYITSDDRSFPVPAIAHQTFKLCVELTEFNYSNPNYTKGDIKRDRIVGDELLRGVKSATKQYQLLTQAISKKAKDAKLNRRISYRSAMLSGFFYRINKLEKKGMIDFQEEAIRFVGEKEYKLDKSNLTQAGMQNRIAKELRADYELWKKVFKK